MRYLILCFLCVNVCGAVANYKVKPNKPQKFNRKVVKVSHASSKVAKVKVKHSKPSSAGTVKFWKETKFMKDNYTRVYDPTFNKNNKKWKEWIKISKRTFKPIKYVPYNIKGLRMIAELRATYNKKHIKAELEYFKTQGYNAVLACWRGKKLERLLENITTAQELGFKIWFTFGGAEKVEETVYIDTDKYAQGLRELASVCDGFVLAWRRTSRHLFMPEKCWIDYTLENVRKGNKDIPIIGEIYYGYEASQKKHGVFTKNIPDNISAVMMTNMGYRNSRPKGIIKLARKYTQLPIIGVVVGDHAYYLTKYNNHKTKKENRAICREIEDRFTKAGISGTITLAGDGSDRINGYDNLSQSNWHKQ